jgi:zinc D-Ala-D-Ala carboxypeptidase
MGKIIKYTIYILLTMLVILALYLTFSNEGFNASNKSDPDTINEINNKIEGVDAFDIIGNQEMLILVNKQNGLSPNYKPEDLTKVNEYAPGRDESTRYMRKEASDSINLMLADAKELGLDIVITTAFRGYNLQKIIFENNVLKSGSIEEANKTSAKPGESEHQTGLAADLSSSKINYELNTSFGELEEGKWISQNAWEYGFILRYQADKFEITGYNYEPWHIRYVGKEFAKYIYDNNLTLEEFISEREQNN